MADGSSHNLTIENLCRKLDVTKGSFYHHFSSLSSFIEQFMEDWRDGVTKTGIDFIDKVTSPEERLLALTLRVIDSVPVRFENSVRSWAQRDETVRKFLSEVDEMRTKYVIDQYLQLGLSRSDAIIHAKMKYAIYIGLHYLQPEVKDEEFVKISNKYDSLVLKMEKK